MLSILGGVWGGRKLQVPSRAQLRPSLGRVKSSIFSILEAIQWKRVGNPAFENWHCCDLFAGVGGLGLEMLSRGASHCVFVEKEKDHYQALKKNIESFDCENRVEAIWGDVLMGEWKKFSPFDLVLLDPPYANHHQELLNTIASEGILKPKGIVLFEHDPKFLPKTPDSLHLHSQRKLGPAGISVFIRDEG